MKVKTINRVEAEFTKERREDVKKVFRNLDPTLHTHEKATEYTRALNAVKLDRVFAKPFLHSFAHDDGVYALATNAKRLNCVFTGCADGGVRLWDVPAQRCLRRLVGHSGAVTGISVTPDGESVVTASTDCTVKLWKAPYAPFTTGVVEEDASPVMEFEGKHAFRDIDHHWNSDTFATAGSAVDVWDHERAEPTATFTWGAESVLSVRFNPAEPDLFATTASDRAIALYDLRSATPIRKLIMQTKTNKLCWNPMEAFNFTAANEDCCLYTYDMRKLKSAACVHKDFVSAVMDVDYSPTGREFVAGSYDRSVRIFRFDAGHSREVYTTKRMQRVFAVRYSRDASYVFTGSDDMNMRVWKANASEQLGVKLPREQAKQQYQEALVKRYAHMPEIKRINRHRHLPGAIYKAGKLRTTMENAESKRERNRIAHAAPGSRVKKPARKKKIVTEME